MIRARVVWSSALALLCLAPVARAGGLDVELWTDRGHDAVYKPGDPLEVRVRTSEDAYLMVYEIDAEGRVRLVSPEWGERGFVAGGETLDVPSPRSDFELVVDGPVGQGYLVAIASRDPFRSMPWYLRPYNPQAEELGYVGAPDEHEEEGVTTEGRIVGDPFVAMERIRRRVLADPEDEHTFATAYTSYYVHHAVRYPRYLCNDCHRPNRWAWWDGFDPYYTSCSVVDFRINYSWGWGPAYWYGYVPYYYYVVRADCPPRYRMFTTRDACFSSWDGWRRWGGMWGGQLVRYKSPPPPGYVAPSKFDERTRTKRPPGFLAVGRNVPTGRRSALFPTSRETRRTDDRWTRGERTGRLAERLSRPTERSRPTAETRIRSRERTEVRFPVRERGRERVEQRRDRNEVRFPARERSESRWEQPRGRSEVRFPARDHAQPRFERPREQRSTPRFEAPRERSQPRFEAPRERSQPRFEQPRPREETRVRAEPQRRNDDGERGARGKGR